MKRISKKLFISKLNKSLGKMFFAFSILILLLTPVNVNAQDGTKAKNLEVYGVAFLKTMFLYVDYNDATAAIKVYVDELQRELITGFKMKPVMFENTEDLLNNYSKENIAVITLSPVEYLAYKSKLSLNPVIVSSGENSVLENYTILVRKDANIDKINNLEDKQIGMLPKESNPSPVMWLDVYLNENKITSKEKFFSKVIIGKTESQLIMSVFFGQLNACLVSKSSFETMIELNPQIKNQIKVLKTSPGFLTSVASFTTKFKKSKDSESLLSHLLTLDTYPAGKQLFTLTKTAKIVLFKDEYLDNIKILISEYNKLLRQNNK